MMENFKEIKVLVEIISANNLSPSISKSSVKSEDTHDWIAESARNIISCEESGPNNIAANSLPNSKTSTSVKLNPFCRVEYKNELLHQTQRIKNDCNPIWTIDTGALFIFTISLNDVIKWKKGSTGESSALVFEIRHKRDALMKVSRSSLGLSNSQSLGFVSISPLDIVKKFCTEERLELQLSDTGNIKQIASRTHIRNKLKRGSIALRFRIATDNDILFVQHINRQIREKNMRIENAIFRKNKFHILDENESNTKIKRVALTTEVDEREVAGNEMVDNLTSAAFSLQESMFSLREQVSLRSTKQSTKKAVKPFPNPNDPSNTRFMTDEQIESETFHSSSQRWIEAGSGKVGKIYLEILACHNLPNMDVGEAIGNVTDCFVSAVYEDVLVQTPVIKDELSPRWLPWTERAFMFHVMHPSSMLYLGVFDYDLGLTGHEPIGRVAVNVGNLKKGINYTLKYGLYPSSNITERKENGSITIRLRIEVNDERAFLLAGLKPHPRMYVNVKKEKSFKVARYTCFGEYGEEETFDLTVLRSYINEILEYKTNISYSISDALTSLVFWRGTVKVGSTFLPIHSAIFFTVSTTVIDRPHLFPAMFFFSLAWIMLTCMGTRLNNPSPWAKCNSFLYFLSVLLRGQSPIQGKQATIEAKQYLEEAIKYEHSWKKRVEKDWETAAKQAELNNKINHIGNENIETKISTGLEIELFTRLGRWQNIIGSICKFLRRIRIIMIWEVSSISFWITLVFLALGIISLILPMTLILHLIVKSIVWIFFGPWMKLVDMILTAEANNTEQSIEKIASTIQKRSQMARIKREEAEKLKRVKELKYGDYIIPIPGFNLSRHYDRPLADSVARPIGENAVPILTEKEVWGLIPGQQLYGVMIPRPEEDMEQNHKQSLSKRDHIISILESTDYSHSDTNELDTALETSMTKSLLRHYPKTEDNSDINELDAALGTSITNSSQRHHPKTMENRIEENYDEGYEVVLRETLSMHNGEIRDDGINNDRIYMFIVEKALDGSFPSYHQNLRKRHVQR